MKKIGIYILLAAFAFTAISGTAESSSSESEVKCNTKALKKEGISLLNPYYYSSSKVNIITYGSEKSRKEIEVPLFRGEKYRLIFNKTELPKDVEIRIYDKSDEHTGRTPVFTSTKEEEGKMVIYEPKKAKRLYVNYIIPPAEGEEQGGCLVFILGYQLTFVTDAEESDSQTEASE